MTELVNSSFMAWPINSEWNLDYSRSVILQDVDRFSDQNDEMLWKKISKIFSLMLSGLQEEDASFSLLLQEQMPLLTKYLKSSTKWGCGGEIYNEMAPWIAILWYELSRSWFWRWNIDIWNIDSNLELERISKERYYVSLELFDQLLKKMYPEGTSTWYVLSDQLKNPLSRVWATAYWIIKEGIDKIYQWGLPDDNECILDYQNWLDSLIQFTWDTLGKLVELLCGLWKEERSDINNDLLTLSMVLKELQKLRMESVKHLFVSDSYTKLHPLDLKKIETLSRKIKN